MGRQDSPAAWQVWWVTVGRWQPQRPDRASGKRHGPSPESPERLHVLQVEMDWRPAPATARAGPIMTRTRMIRGQCTGSSGSAQAPRPRPGRYHDADTFKLSQVTGPRCHCARDAAVDGGSD